MVKLATGQQMATFMKSKGVNLTKLTNAQIRDGNGGADLERPDADAAPGAAARHAAVALRAARGGAEQRPAKGVGARIVAETFHRAIEGSTHSIVRDTAFAPTLGPNSTTFRMVDLLLFAFEGKKALLNPNG